MNYVMLHNRHSESQLVTLARFILWDVGFGGFFVCFVCLFCKSKSSSKLTKYNERRESEKQRKGEKMICVYSFRESEETN